MAVIIPIATLIIIISQMRGCTLLSQNELLNAIHTGANVTIELAESAVPVNGSFISKVTWVQLDQLKMHDNGFRGGFDKLVGVEPIKNKGGSTSKTGCLYVNKNSERDGNTTLQDAFRNKVFTEKYWNDINVQMSMSSLAKTVYDDIEDSEIGTIASLNGYYNLINDHVNPDSFNANKSITREEFYTLVFKATNPVREIKAGDKFSMAVGGETQYTKYAAQVESLGFLQTSNKSLNQETITSSMSRAEAIYMVVNALFPDELNTLTGKEKCYSDVRLQKNMLEKLKIESNQPWQRYVLAYSVQNPDKGIHENLYNSLVVAYKLGLCDTEKELRWDEPISKYESLELLAKAFQAQNSLYGYLTEVENGTVIDNFFDNSPLTTDVNGSIVEEIIPVENPYYTVDPVTGVPIKVPGVGIPSNPDTDAPVPEISITEEYIDGILNGNKPKEPVTTTPPTPSNPGKLTIDPNDPRREPDSEKGTIDYDSTCITTGEHGDLGFK